MNFIVHYPAIEHKFQVTKLVELNIKQSLAQPVRLAQPVSIISEQAAITTHAYMAAWLVTPLSRKSPLIFTNSRCSLNEGSLML